MQPVSAPLLSMVILGFASEINRAFDESACEGQDGPLKLRVARESTHRGFEWQTGTFIGELSNSFFRLADPQGIGAAWTLFKAAERSVDTTQIGRNASIGEGLDRRPLHQRRF